MEGDFIKINEWLRPLAWLYGLAVRFRNFLFDTGILKSRSFDIPVISVGNITVGGAGKTPHVEYLIRLLHNNYKVAVLSRGYKRKTKGYILANDTTTMTDIGDEPYQMHRKFSDINVAVDANRCRGVERLTTDRETRNTNVILLDDAYQHRYIKPGINILLVDYHRLIVYDKLLPAGRLREPMSGKTRADIVIITKCPKDLKPMSFRVLQRALALFPYQELYFTHLEYGNLQSMYGNEEIKLSDLKKHKHILLLTGIASPEHILKDLKPYANTLHDLRYSDHHNFREVDIDNINSTFASMPEGSIIVTTEKDAMRLYDVGGLSKAVKRNIYILPVEVKVMLDEEEKFNQKIINYVHKNSRNRNMVER